MLAPGLLDRYLARMAWTGQQDDEPLAEQYSDNLWQSVGPRHATRGRFGHESSSGALQFQFSIHRQWVTAALLAAGVCGCLAARRRWR